MNGFTDENYDPSVHVAKAYPLFDSQPLPAFFRCNEHIVCLGSNIAVANRKKMYDAYIDSGVTHNLFTRRACSAYT